MRNDHLGQQILSENDLCDLYMSDPSRNIKRGIVESDIIFDPDLQLENVPELTRYIKPAQAIPKHEFDKDNQDVWFMPKEYIDMDIAQWVLDQCNTQAELQRAGEELIMYQERDMFTFLRYLKYLVDTMRQHNVIWGVGRGSSVSSYVLYLIGIHRINSLLYDLSIDEFLK